MKKTLNVNIGGMPFILDEDAYERLKTYLSEIEIRLDGYDKQEILDDIENRIADIFHENLSTRVQVVSLEVVNRAMAIIGSAREFGEPRRRTEAQTQPAAAPTDPASQRLVRSHEDRIIGGVCGGVAERYQLDPALVRVLTVVLTLFTGVALLIYIVLWIILPSAPLSQTDSTPHYQ